MNSSQGKIEEAASKEGMKPLIVSGLEAVKQGLTTIEEVLKVAEE